MSALEAGGGAGADGIGATSGTGGITPAEGIGAAGGIGATSGTGGGAGAGPTVAAAAGVSSEPWTSAPVPLPLTPPAPIDKPPMGQKFPAIIPLPDAATQLDSCPYPEEARRLVETGSVVLLVHVAPDGTVASTHVETSSGSVSLDRGAANCVKQYGRFTPKVVGKPSAGYWGRMKFIWSFGN